MKFLIIILFLFSCGRENDSSTPPQIPVPMQDHAAEKAEQDLNLPGSKIPDLVIDPEMDPIVSEFKEAVLNAGLEIKGKNLRVIHFVNTSNDFRGLTENTVGYCVNKARLDFVTLVTLTWRELTIIKPRLQETVDPGFSSGNVSYEFNLKLFMWHELGHCLLRKNHDPNPGEIMSTEMLPFTPKAENWDLLSRKFLDPAYQAALPDLP